MVKVMGSNPGYLLKSFLLYHIKDLFKKFSKSNVTKIAAMIASIT